MKGKGKMEGTQNTNAFTSLVNQLVKVIYTDSGGQVKIRKGRLLAADSDFIRLKTYEHTYVIKRSTISELKTFGEGSE